MSLKLLYNEIKTKIETDVPEIKAVRLYNNQFSQDNLESALPYPIALIEFSSIEWNNKIGGLQSGAVSITIHIGFKSLENEHVAFWDITQKLFQTLNGFSTTDFSPMIRQQEIQDTDHDGVLVWQQTYFINELNDCDNYVHKDKTTTTATDIEINTDLDVFNLTLRTGDGQFNEPIIPPPTGYDPLTDDDLVMFYDFSGLVVNTDNEFGTVDASGLVGNWKDLKGTANYNLIQSVTTEKPLLTLSGIEADGINDFLETLDLPTEIKTGGDFTFVMVGENIGGVTSNLISFQGNTYLHYVLGFILSTNKAKMSTRSGAGTTTLGIENNLVLSVGETYISRNNYQDNYTLILNEQEGQTGDEPHGTNPLPNKLRFGSFIGSSTAYYTTKIKAIMVWKNELTDAQKITDLNTYLSEKWS